MLKITMPIYTVTFPQDFLKVIFLTGGGHGPPLESPMIMDDSALVTAFQSNVSEMMSVQHRTQGNATLSVLVIA